VYASSPAGGSTGAPDVAALYAAGRGGKCPLSQGGGGTRRGLTSSCAASYLANSATTLDTQLVTVRREGEGAYAPLSRWCVLL
jgi:hypothetical protein